MFLGNTELNLMIHIYQIPSDEQTRPSPRHSSWQHLHRAQQLIQSHCCQHHICAKSEIHKSHSSIYPQIIWGQLTLLSTMVQHLIIVLTWVQLRLCMENFRLPLVTAIVWAELTRNDSLHSLGAT